MTGRGGWPMTVFLTPDGRPFFGGTYYPPQRRHGMPSFTEVIVAVRDAWRDRRDASMRRPTSWPAPSSRAPSWPRRSDERPTSGSSCSRARTACCAPSTTTRGAASAAHRSSRSRRCSTSCCDRTATTAATRPRSMVRTSLDAMASGGIYDHLGGGFARYSVDGQWLVPHFEKMLYDQAGLIRVYLHAWQVTGEPRYRQVVEETIGYVLARPARARGRAVLGRGRRLRGRGGQLLRLVPRRRGEIGGPEAVQWYGVTAEGNFEGATSSTARSAATWCGRRRSRRRASDSSRRAPTRVRPGLDDKVLTEWNAMFLSALGRGGRRHRTTATGIARTPSRSASSCCATLRDADGRWLRSWHGGPGQAACVRGRLRLAGRRLHPPGRAHRRGPVDREARADAPTRCCACSGTTSGAGCSPPGPTPSA